MNLKILLPFEIFADKRDVLRIVVDTSSGSYGLLPHRLDCIAALVPGILLYETAAEGEVSVAIDGGVLVKAGDDVRVSVHRAIGGTDLSQLHAAVEKEFKRLNEAEQDTLLVMAKLESGLISRMASFHNE